MNTTNQTKKNEVENQIHYNNYKLTADKILQLLDKIYGSVLSDKRWVWELMQNAKDVPNRFGRVSVRIDLFEDKLVFSHNGDCFEIKDLTGLIQQVSSKDGQNQGGQTGKFGTGFITTHLLSGVIGVEGIVYNKSNDKYQRFKLELDRSVRETEAMIEDIKKNLNLAMQLGEGDEVNFPVVNNYDQRTEQDFDTAFTYPLSGEGCRSAQKGLADLVNTLPITMVSLHKIKQVRVVNHIDGTDVTYSCENETLHAEDGYKIICSTVRINEEEKQYLTYSTDEVALSIETRFEDGKPVLLKRDRNQPVLFRDFPLIGSEQFHFPYVINGFNLEPTEERSEILLNRNEEKAQKNRAIIEKAVEAALQFDLWLISQGARNTYLLARSRKPALKYMLDEEYASPWLSQLQKDWRKELLMQHLLETEEGYAPLSEIRIPDFGSVNNKKEANHTFYMLLRPFVDNGTLPKEEQLEEWCKAICTEYKEWGADLRISRESFMEQLTDLGNLQQLAGRLHKDETNTLLWLNTLYAFLLSEGDTTSVEQYAIVPDQYGNFHKLDQVSTDEGDRIPEALKDIACKFFNRDLCATMLHTGISAASLKGIKTYTLTDMTEEVCSIFRKHHKTLSEGRQMTCDEIQRAYDCTVALAHIYSDQEGCTKEDRERVYQLIHAVANRERTYVEGLNAALWQEVDRYACRILPGIIRPYKTVSAMTAAFFLTEADCISWINLYVATASALQVAIPSNWEIIPNQNGSFCKLTDLHHDNGISPLLIGLNITATSNDWRGCLIHKDILGFDDHQPLGVKDLYESVMKAFDYAYITTDKKLSIATAAMGIIPLNDDGTCDEECKKLYDLAARLIAMPGMQTLTKEEAEDFYWEKPAAYIAETLCKTVKNTETLSALGTLLSEAPEGEETEEEAASRKQKEEEEAAAYTDELIGYVRNYKGGRYAKYTEDHGIWINQKGEMCLLKDISKDAGTDDALKQLCLNPHICEDYYEKLLRKGMKCEQYVMTEISNEDILKKLDDGIMQYMDEKGNAQPSFSKLIFGLNTILQQHKEYGAELKFFVANKDRMIVLSIEDSDTISIISGLVGDKKKLELAGKLTEIYTADELAQISGISDKLRAQEEENETLRMRIAELEAALNGDDSLQLANRPHHMIRVSRIGGETAEIDIEESPYGGPDRAKKMQALTDAKEAVLAELDNQGYDISQAYGTDASTYGNIYGVKDPEGNDCPLVVHSYIYTDREFALTAFDWEQLAQRNSMLWIVTHDGPRCMRFYDLALNQGIIHLSFNAGNLDCKDRMIALAEIMRYFKGLHFNFGRMLKAGSRKAEKFNQPARELAERLGADDVALLPA